MPNSQTINLEIQTYYQNHNRFTIIIINKNETATYKVYEITNYPQFKTTITNLIYRQLQHHQSMFFDDEFILVTLNQNLNNDPKLATKLGLTLIETQTNVAIK